MKETKPKKAPKSSVVAPKSESSEGTPVKKMGTVHGRLFKTDKSSAALFDEKGQIKKEETEKLDEFAKKHLPDEHSPIAAIGTPASSEDGDTFPLSVYTTSNAKLERVGVYGSLAVYARLPAIRRDAPEKHINAVVDEVLTEKEISESPRDKKQVFDSTTAQRNPLKKASRKQDPVMDNVSAKEVTEEYFNIEAIGNAIESLELDQEAKDHLYKQFEEFVAEYLHLKPYALVGEHGQNKANLIWGSKEANTQMMVIEAYCRDRFRQKKHVRFEVTAYKAQNHIARKIETIVTTDLTLSPIKVIFNPFTRRTTVTQERVYVQGFDKVRLAAKLKKQAEQSEDTANTVKVKKQDEQPTTPLNSKTKK